ncbi:MAG TPA: PspC domain-containing protein [Bacteroidales bacterium]|nr:PspC domain-containing protein [Bacteroidales bacterium]HOK73820.1 PspC domain-containing protein [Bacteroidales bacterium]HOM40076.1 PspC domain-containing protein [Bacteroidales bacterium]HOU31127.1 PspC domain-containing protein [Bacteroidales bacterium]HPP91739.1 PspC domain-containing protein [Bacteroidales bacterium]
MKITLSVNLGGYSFNIDEDAYEELSRYLKSLESSFASEKSASEIMSDIEDRIAELFREKISGYKQVITIEDVREVISILGRPEDFAFEGEGTGSSRDDSSRYSGRSHRMYRDPDNRILGGVCAGIGAYWRIEPWIIRIIFLALMFAGGFGLLIYIILWIVLPEARTIAQKIEMRGEPVNIQSIKEAVKREFEQVRRRMNI